MRFGTWNVRSLYRAGSLKTAARECGKYKLEWVYRRPDGRKGALKEQRIIHFSIENGMNIIN
jgi:hypothetical protein